MQVMVKILKFLWELILVLLFKWVLWIIRVVRALVKKLITYCRKKKLPRAERKEVNQRCVPINSPVYHKPDPMLYSQPYLMSKGLAVTWDNPDIQLKKNGVPVDSSKLEPNTEYEVEARIWNNSMFAPAPDMPVKFSYLDFGIGTTPIFISETLVDLGVKGGAQCPAYAKATWKTPATEGHYCLQVLLKWSDDAEPNNNLGQENTNVGIFHSPAHFSFRLKNRKKRKDTIRFETDTYTLPVLMDCDEKEKTFTHRKDPLALHRRNNYPIPEGWIVKILPEITHLEPGEEIEVTVEITHPTGFAGEKRFNINGFDLQNNLVGGITLLTQTQL
jgi:hypothetical protein